MRTLLLCGVIAGCGGGTDGSGPSSSPWYTTCAYTTTTFPESCGDVDVDRRGDLVGVTVVDTDGVGVAVLDADGSWRWFRGGTDPLVEPRLVTGPWTRLDGGDDTLCGLHDDGTGECFDVYGGVYGDRYDVPLFAAEPFGREALLDLQVGRDTVCGLAAADGEVRCAGSDRLVGPIAPWSGAMTALSHAGDGWVGLRADGELEGWTPAGPAGVFPPGPFTAVGGSPDAGCAVQGDGALSCWGAFADGAPLAAAFERVDTSEDGLACALTTDGTPACWGPGATLCDDAEVAGPFVALDLGVFRAGLQRDGSAVVLPEYYPEDTTRRGCYE